MAHRYTGTADLTYRTLVKQIKDNKRLSQKAKDELLANVDHLVGHILEDIDFSLRNQYANYSACGSEYLQARHWFSNSRDMLMEVLSKVLAAVAWERKRFTEMGHVDRT